MQKVHKVNEMGELVDEDHAYGITAETKPTTPVQSTKSVEHEQIDGIADTRIAETPSSRRKVAPKMEIAQEEDENIAPVTSTSLKLRYLHEQTFGALSVPTLDTPGFSEGSQRRCAEVILRRGRACISTELLESAYTWV